MCRFYDPNLGALLAGESDRVVLDHGQSHHAIDVMRVQIGDRITLFDGLGTVADALVEDTSDKLNIQVVSSIKHRPPCPAITVCSAVPKGPRFDQLVNQLCQVGIDRFIPLQTKRSVVIPRPQKLERMRRVTIETAKQSHHPYLMQIEQLSTLDHILDEPVDLQLLCDAPIHKPVQVNNGHAGEVSPLAAATRNDIATRVSQAGTVHLIIGPEGGWTDRERHAAQQAGCTPWQFNTGVLRVETAAVAAASIVRYLAVSHDNAPTDHTQVRPAV